MWDIRIFMDNKMLNKVLFQGFFNKMVPFN